MNTAIRGSHSMVRRFGCSDSGAAAVEYALLAAFIGLGIVAALVSTRSTLSSTYSTIATDVSVDDPYPIPRLSNFADKTMTNKRTMGFGATQRVIINFSDGSYGSYRTLTSYNGLGEQLIDASTGANISFNRVNTDSNGRITSGSIIFSNYSASNPYYDQTSYTFNSDGTASGTFTTYTQSGEYVSGPNTIPTVSSDKFSNYYTQIQTLKAY